MALSDIGAIQIKLTMVSSAHDDAPGLSTEGIVFAWEKKDFQTTNHCPWSETMNASSNQTENSKDGSSDWTLSLEAIIAMGLFGWLALSMTLMGFGIW